MINDIILDKIEKRREKSEELKKVLITGGATGIGKACAEMFRDRGYDVVITYNKTLPDIENVCAVKCNLEKTDEIKSLFDEVKDIDILINNAGVSLIKMINDVSFEDYENNKIHFLVDMNAVFKLFFVVPPIIPFSFFPSL